MISFANTEGVAALRRVLVAFDSTFEKFYRIELLMPESNNFYFA